jgi:shikimate dehydrogenase
LEKSHQNKKKIFLLGKPLNHSLSPIMFNLSFSELGLNYEYIPMEVAAEHLGETIDQMKNLKFDGANLTIPLKERVMKYCDEISTEAKQTGAVNTLFYRDQKLIGFNTDIFGFRDSFKRNNLGKKRVLVIGAGGAAHAVIYSLIQFFNVTEIILINRDSDRATQLSQHFNPAFVKVGKNITETYAKADLIINTTPVGMFPKTEESPVPSRVFHRGQIVYDLVYNPLETKMLAEAREAGAEVMSGLEMLVQQGKHAFKIWTGQEMPVDLVREILVGKLKQRSK